MRQELVDYVDQQAGCWVLPELHTDEDRQLELEQEEIIADIIRPPHNAYGDNRPTDSLLWLRLLGCAARGIGAVANWLSIDPMRYAEDVE